MATLQEFETEALRRAGQTGSQSDLETLRRQEFEGSLSNDDRDRLVGFRRKDLTDRAAGGGFGNILDSDTGAPFAIRANVGSAESRKDKLSTLRNTFPEAIPFGDGNFVFMNPETGGRPTLVNPPRLEMGDIAGVIPEIGEMLGGVVGGAMGLASPVPGGTLIGAGIGAAAGRELATLPGRLMGRVEETRTGGQVAGDLATTAAVNTLGQGAGDIAAAGLRRAARGIGSRLAGRTAPELAEDFTRAEVTPRSAGTLTGARPVQILEQGLASSIGGGERVARSAGQMLDELSASVTRLADETSPVFTPAQAGAQLQRGGEEFITGFRKTSTELEDAAAKLIQNPITPLGNTTATLDDISRRFASNPALAETLGDPLLARVRQALTESNGNLPFKELRALRSEIGRKLNSPKALSDIPRADYERVYGAMSEDIREQARAISPKALAAFNKATRFERQGFERIKASLQEITNPDSRVSGEKIFGLVQNIAQERGVSANIRKLAQIRRSVSPEQWRAVAAVTLRRLGNATPGQQGAEGATFSAETFLTNYNRLSPKARNVLFGGTLPKGGREALDSLVRVTGAIRDFNRTGNPSGTARVANALSLFSALGATGGAVAGGDVASAGLGAATGIGGRMLGMGAANASARLITNPRFARWLARAGSIALRGNQNSMTRHLGRLGVVAAAEPDIRDEVRQYIDALREAPPEAQL